MKNIAIFCDGTWQNIGQRYPTNVAALARAVSPDQPGKPNSSVYYDDGVGVGAGVADQMVKIFGGAFGQGLDDKIIRAYEFLCLNYVPGDRIFVFGFSRGAFTARSLVGLLRWAWILKREEVGRVYDVMALYRSHPSSDAPQADQDAFTSKMSAVREAHCYAEAPFLSDQPYDAENPSSLTPLGGGRSWIQYVGVWDTVGSLGIPPSLPFADVIDAKYHFYDTSLSRLVRSARHAVSIDERRGTFEPTLWTNIGDLNANAHATELVYDKRPYQQQWFPGGHGDVGGGGDDGGISLAAMLWIAEGAARAGLNFDEAMLSEYAKSTKPAADFPPADNSVAGRLLASIGEGDRQGPNSVDEVSLSARLRWHERSDYRPNPLKRVQSIPGQLDAWSPPVIPEFYYP